VNKKEPKFSKGDLAMIVNPIANVGGDKVAIVVSEPTLVLMHQWEKKIGYPSEFWSYDVVIDGQLFREIPEKMLGDLKNENEEDSK
jgi:hypothetical protein